MAINYTYPAKSTPTTSDKVLIIDNEDTTNPQSTKTATIQSIVSLATGSGDVTGPTSATDNAIARFDTTTGKLIQNSSATIDDDGNVTAPDFIGDLNGAVRFEVKAIGTDIDKGEVIYLSGISGNTPEAQLARANSSSTMPAFGIATEDIAQNNTGNIATFGSVRGLRVSDFGETSITFSLGDTIYVSATEAGKLTNVPPTGESNLIQNIGKIERASPTTNMTIKVGGAGRTNATPNLDSGKMFLGNASNQSVSVAMSGDVTIDNAGVTTVNATITNGAAAGAVALPLAGGEMSGTIAGNQDIIGKRPTIVDTNATLTLQDDVHEGAFLYSNAATATTITIDPFSSEPFANGTEIKIMRGATPPSVTVTPGSGVSLNGGTGGISIASAYGTLTLKQLSVDVWVAYV